MRFRFRGKLSRATTRTILRDVRTIAREPGEIPPDSGEIARAVRAAALASCETVLDRRDGRRLVSTGTWVPEFRP